MIAHASHPSPRRRRAFTLVELLVVITVIGILAGLVYGAVSAAQKTSKVTQTRTTISKIHRIIMRQMAEYRTRRVPEAIPITVTNRRQAAELKLNRLRDLIRMEMPDRWTDVTNVVNWDAFVSSGTLPPWGPTTEPRLLVASSPAASHYFYRQLHDAAEEMAGHPDCVERIVSHAAAELLYLIVMRDCENAEQFRSDEIGDYDGDGLMEFHDAWGRPIRFLRWPAGFFAANGAQSKFQSGNPAEDDDPFDTLGIYKQVAYRLVPLIYSAGPDGIYDINIGSENGTQTYRYKLTPGAFLTAPPILIDPYVLDGNSPPQLIGTPLDGKDVFTEADANGKLDHKDNIHNHQVDK